MRVSDSDATDPTPVRRNTAEHHVLLALELQRAGCRGVGGAAGSCDSGYCRSRGTGPGELADVGHGGLADAGVRELGAGVRTAQRLPKTVRLQRMHLARRWSGGPVGDGLLDGLRRVGPGRAGRGGAASVPAGDALRPLMPVAGNGVPVPGAAGVAGEERGDVGADRVGGEQPGAGRGDGGGVDKGSEAVDEQVLGVEDDDTSVAASVRR